MFNIGPAELLVVLVIALLVLGPSKLPDAARQVGRALGEMRKLSSGFQAEMRDALKEPVEGKPTTSSKSVSSSKAVSSSSSDPDTADTGGSLSAPRPPGEPTLASGAAVGDESGLIGPTDAGAGGATGPGDPGAGPTGAGDRAVGPDAQPEPGPPGDLAN